MVLMFGVNSPQLQSFVTHLSHLTLTKIIKEKDNLESHPSSLKLEKWLAACGVRIPKRLRGCSISSLQKGMDLQLCEVDRENGSRVMPFGFGMIFKIGFKMLPSISPPLLQVMPPSASTLRVRARAGSPADCSLSLVPLESPLLVNCWLIGVGEGGAFLFPFVIVILIPPPFLGGGESQNSLAQGSVSQQHQFAGRGTCPADDQSEMLLIVRPIKIFGTQLAQQNGIHNFLRCGKHWLQCLNMFARET